MPSNSASFIASVISSAFSFCSFSFFFSFRSTCPLRRKPQPFRMFGALRMISDVYAFRTCRITSPHVVSLSL